MPTCTHVSLRGGLLQPGWKMCIHDESSLIRDPTLLSVRINPRLFRLVCVCVCVWVCVCACVCVWRPRPPSLPPSRPPPAPLFLSVSLCVSGRLRVHHFVLTPCTLTGIENTGLSESIQSKWLISWVKGRKGGGEEFVRINLLICYSVRPLIHRRDSTL